LRDETGEVVGREVRTYSAEAARDLFNELARQVV
jgi:hypothetical protein